MKFGSVRRVRIRLDAVVVLGHDVTALPENLTTTGMYQAAMEAAVRDVPGVVGVEPVERRVELDYRKEKKK